jgi:hypothetical protein
VKNKEWFIQRYSDLHENLNKLENEIENHLENKSEIVKDDRKLNDLKKRTIETIDLLQRTRDDERRIFNYGK